MSKRTEILRITRSEIGDVEVWQGEKTSCSLTYGEVLEQVLSLLGINIRSPYPMLTPKEWEERWHLSTDQEVQGEEP